MGCNKGDLRVREPDIDNVDIMELDTHNFVITEPDTKNANAMQLYIHRYVGGGD